MAKVFSPVFAVPLAFVTLLLLPRLLLHVLLDERSAFVLFTLSVMASAWYGGMKSGLMATVLSVIAGVFLVLRPQDNLPGEDLTDALEVMLFAVTGVGISWMAGQLQRARTRAEESERDAKAAHQRTKDILESINDAFHGLDGNLCFVYLNAAAERLFGRSKEELAGKHIFDEFPAFRNDKVELQFRRVIRDGEAVRFEHFFESWQRWCELRVFPSGLGGLSVYMSDITARKSAEAEREGLIAELQTAMTQVKVLRGLLPICANCKKIRDQDGSWRQIESYIQKHSDAEFSHGICPGCLERLYPEFADSW